MNSVLIPLIAIFAWGTLIVGVVVLNNIFSLSAVLSLPFASKSVLQKTVIYLIGDVPSETIKSIYSKRVAALLDSVSLIKLSPTETASIDETMLLISKTNNINLASRLPETILKSISERSLSALDDSLIKAERDLAVFIWCKPEEEGLKLLKEINSFRADYYLKSNQILLELISRHLESKVTAALTQPKQASKLPKKVTIGEA
jgi:hypothetical protein